METTTLGATGLTVSVMGLGCGGHSRLGLSYGRSDAEAATVAKRAIDLGITLIDTAESYRTETAVGIALAEAQRDRLVVSTKAAVEWQGRRCTGPELEQRLDASLRRLRTDYVDIYHLHGVAPDEYDYACSELVPTMLRLRDAGKIRLIGITEGFIGDTGHAMLSRALQDDIWQVIMVGFNLLNPSARDRVFPVTMAKGIGTLCMFAVRRALSRPEALSELVRGLVAAGRLDPSLVDVADPLGWLVREGHARSVPEAAYRFCRHEQGMDVILSGTGSVDHLEENARSLAEPPLSKEAAERLRAMFGNVDTVSGN